MKKILSALAAVTAIFAVYSCQREADYITDPAQAVTVTYSVSLDQVQKTKATLADLETTPAVDKLFYSVYQKVGENFNPINHSDYHKVVALTGGTADITVKLIQNETYKIVFWAQKGNAYLDASNEQLATDGVLENITIDYTASDSYAEDRDAFTAYDVITLDPVTQGADYGTSFSKEIHLKRPFAQINFGTDDAAQAAAQGFTASKVQVTVKQAATAFNAATGVAGGAADAALKESELPGTSVLFDVNGVTYTRVAKAYILPVGTFTVSQTGSSAAISDALATTPEVSMVLTIKNGDNELNLDPRSRANTNIQSNYRTNLLGSLITTDATFNVVVDNDYDGSTDHIVSIGNASGSGAITMGEAETITADINFNEHASVDLDATLTVDGNVTIRSNGTTTINIATPIIVTTGNTLTLDNVTLAGKGSNETLIEVEEGGKVIIDGGEYTGTITVATVTPAPAPAPRPRYTGTKDSANDYLEIRGGTFHGFDPTPFVDEADYVITKEGDDTWTVTGVATSIAFVNAPASLKVGQDALVELTVTKPASLTADPAVTVTGDAVTAEYTEGKVNVTAAKVGTATVTVTLGSASDSFEITVIAADALSVEPTSVSVKVGETSAAVTVTLNNGATVASVVAADATVATVNFTEGATSFTVTGAKVGETTVTVTASNGLTAQVAVTVAKADAVKLATPVPAKKSATDNTIVVTWPKIANASSYTVKYGDTSLAAEKIVAGDTDVEATIEGLAPATEYAIKVVAVGDVENFTNSDEASVDVKTEKGQAVITLATASYEIVEGLTATVEGIAVKYGETAIEGANVTLTAADDKITVADGVITAVAVGSSKVNVGFAGNDTYLAASAEISVTVKAKTLTGIELNTELVKKSFTVGEEFVSTNLQVFALYDNNTKLDVTSEANVTAPDLATAGEKTVTVTYSGKTASYTINVAENTPAPKTDQEITLKLGNEVIGTTLNKTFGDAAFTITAEAPSNNVVLTSKNTAVATVSGTNITIVKAGEAVIEATAAETETYNAAPAKNFTLVVAKADNEVLVEPATLTIAVGATGNTTAVANDDAALSVSSSDSNVATATIDNEGNIVVNGVSKGSATITVKAAATDNYNEATATIAVTVEEEQVDNGSGTQADPYTVAGAVAYIGTLGSDESASPVYVKGKIQSIRYTFNREHGTATFDITADGSASDEKVQAYSLKYLGNTAWVDGLTQIEVGDEVVLYGTALLYTTNGNNPTSTNEIKDGYIYKLNGVSECEPYLAVDYNNTAAADDTSAELTIISNGSWNIVGGTGVTASPVSGSGNGTATLSFAANTSTTDAKTLTATVTVSGATPVDVSIVQAKAEDPNVTFEYVKVTSVTEGKYLIVFDDNKAHATVLGKDLKETSNTLSINSDKIAKTSDLTASEVTISANGSILLPSGKYLVVGSNACAENTTATNFTYEYKSTQAGMIIKGTTGSNTDRILYKNGTTGWRFYADKTTNSGSLQSGYALPNLYKLTESDGSNPTPETYSVNIGSTTNGTVTASKTTGIEAGESITLTVTPSINYELETLTVDGTNVTSSVSSGNYTFTMPAKDVTVAATFKATEGGQGGGTDTYSKVTSVNDLAAGDIVLFVCESQNVVNGGFSDNGQYLTNVAASITNSTISGLPTGAAEITLGKSGDDWTFTIGETLVGATAAKKFGTGSSAVSTWSISISSGDATITSTTSSYGSIMYNASAPRFLNYSSGQKVIQLYKKN